MKLRTHISDQVKRRMPLLCLELDGEGNILDWHGNPEYFSFDSDRLAEPKPLPAALHSCWETALIDDSDSEFELPFIHLDDKQAAHIYITRFDDHSLMYLFDASREHAVQQHLQQKANELSLLSSQQQETLRALDLAQRELKARRDEAQRASAAKGEFIAAMSHEFRTPISSILGYAEILCDEMDDQQYPNAIRRAAWHLLILVENLLDQATIDQNAVKLNPAPLSLSLIANDLEEMFSLQAENRGIELNIQPPPSSHLTLDELRLRQIIINLVSNAVRYTEHGSVDVDWGYDSGTLRIHVRDTGPGISAADQEKIFLPFQRLGSVKTGAGLGLTITKQLVTAMGGRLELDSTPGQGSCFCVYLPCESVSPADYSGQKLGGRILVVDDDQDLIDLATIILEDWGMTVQAVSTVEEAVAVIHSDPPEVILSDYHLQNSNAEQLIRHMLDRNKQIPLILTSGSQTPGELEARYSGIIYGFLPKPVSMPLLYRLLHGILSPLNATVQ